MELFLRGQVVSQKNSKQIVYNKKTNKPFIISNKRVKDWQSDVSLQLIGVPKVTGCVSISMFFINRDKRKYDLDNFQSSVLDALKNNGIIEDDNCYIVRELHSKFVGVDKENAGVRVVIESIDG